MRPTLFVLGLLAALPTCSSEPQGPGHPPPPPPPPADVAPHQPFEPTPVWIEQGGGLHGAGAEGVFRGLAEDEAGSIKVAERKARAAAVRLFGAFSARLLEEAPVPARKKARRKARKLRSGFGRLGAGLVKVVQRWTEPESGVRFALAEIKLAQVMARAARLRRFDPRAHAFMVERAPALFDEMAAPAEVEDR